MKLKYHYRNDDKACDPKDKKVVNKSTWTPRDDDDSDSDDDDDDDANRPSIGIGLRIHAYDTFESSTYMLSDRPIRTEGDDIYARRQR